MYTDSLDDVVFLLERLNVMNELQYQTGHDFIVNCDISQGDKDYMAEKWSEYRKICMKDPAVQYNQFPEELFKI